MSRTVALLVVTGVLAAGCVSQKEFLAKSQEADRAAATLAAERQRAAELERELAMTRGALAEREQRLAEATATYDKLVADLKGEIADGQVKITRLRDRLTVNLIDKILFDSGSTTLGPRGQDVLHKVADVLKSAKDKQIQIEGHTDNVPVGGALKTRFPTNWELSVARASVVARFLQEQGGISPAVLAATGYGEHHPVASNETPDGRAENRRIEIVLLPVASEVATR